MMMFETVAAVEPPHIKSINNKSEADSSDLIVFRGGFSTGDYSYKFEIKSDRSGAIFYDDSFTDGDEFAHEINVNELRREIEAEIKSRIKFLSQDSPVSDRDAKDIREDLTAEKLEEIFWEEINPMLDDPFFRTYFDDDEWSEEFRCENGRVEELEKFLELCVLTEREIFAPEDYLIVEAETEYEAAGISEGSYFTERLGELAEIACEHFKPTGHRYDYNDGCFDRQSGYSMSPESISIGLREASRIPARKKMLGMKNLREKLEKMSVAPDKIDRLTAF